VLLYTNSSQSDNTAQTLSIILHPSILVQIENAVNGLNDLEGLWGGLCKYWSLTHYTHARGN